MREEAASHRRGFAPNTTSRAETNPFELPIESIALGTRERSLWSRSDPPNNSHETPLPFPPVPTRRPSSPSLASLLPALSLSCLFLFLSRLFALADCVPTFPALPLRPLSHTLSLSLPFARARARNRACGCARSCLVVSLPRLASPYLPTGATASRVIAARYREFLRLLATPISAMAVRPEVNKDYPKGVLQSLRIVKINRNLMPFPQGGKDQANYTKALSPLFHPLIHPSLLSFFCLDVFGCLALSLV